MRGRSLLVLAALLLPSLAGARVVRDVCRDGTIPPPVPCPSAGCLRPPCDVDLECNGACSFAVRSCDATSCTDGVDVVPVGRKLVTQVVTTPGGKATTFVLRCRAHAPHVPCTPSTTTTTTTVPGQECAVDADCGTAAFCAVPKCLNGTCGFVCICAGPTGAPTCCPGPAAACVFTTTTTTLPSSCIPFSGSGCTQTADCCQPCLNGAIAPCAVCLQGVCEGAP